MSRKPPHTIQEADQVLLNPASPSSLLQVFLARFPARPRTVGTAHAGADEEADREHGQARLAELPGARCAVMLAVGWMWLSRAFRVWPKTGDAA
jgi:hypothetical protein